MSIVGGRSRTKLFCLPELAALARARRSGFVIGYDSDASTKPAVLKARSALRQALRCAGSPEVRIVDMPVEPDVEKCGWDDYARIHGREALRAHLEGEAVEDRAPPPKADYAVVTDAWRGRYELRNAALGPGALEFNELKKMPVLGRQSLDFDDAVSRMREAASARGVDVVRSAERCARRSCQSQRKTNFIQ